MESKYTFLLIEDNLIDQLVIKQLFKKVLSIEEIHVANNGKEGIEWLENNGKMYQSIIILLDVQMPVMNGFDFLNKYAELDNDLKKDNQIFVLSSTLDSDEIQRISESRYVTDFLGKPFPIEEFRNKIFPNI
ncbi:response regulator [Flavobacterium aquidurense]|uniref:response regulator n=1 Tax=Flavobacterium aquidurense TaxID=362413 RepID=UPI002862E990|nr:response regulator [Flavobacterium aquidurense]MDR7372735.1 CheY-like chemotaxis protein [Flavobacterium aquidurense]